MRLNDMTPMAEIFLTPLLPYKEFLVTHGKHGAMLMGNDERDHYHARYKFPCGTEVSVISGPLFYCSPDGPYEYRVNGEEPVGHQTDEELFIMLTKIVAGEKPKENKEGYMGGDADHTQQDPVFVRRYNSVVSTALHAAAYTTNPHAHPVK